MSTQMQLRGGTTAENLLFTGAQREITIDTDKNTVVVQDGVTAGGFPLASSSELDDGTFYYNDNTGGGSAANAYILAPKPNTNTPSAYLDGVQFGFVTANANTGPSTANFQGLGVKNIKYPGGVDPAAGDVSGRVYLIYDAANGWLELQRKATGTPPQLRSVTASVGSNALTVGLQPCIIDFRSSTLSSGTVNTRTVPTALSLIVPASATLGSQNGVPSRIAILAIDNAGVPQLAVCNMSGGQNLDETTLVDTVAITAGSTSANVVYSSSSVAGAPFRVMGFVLSTQAVAGTWVSAPTETQGQGGQTIIGASRINLSAAQATTAGTAIDFVGLQPGVKRVTVILSGVSTNGTSAVQVQLGTSGGVETSGYSGAVSVITGAGASLVTYITSGITTVFATAASTRTGNIILSRISGNTWVSTYVIGETPNGQVAQSSGSKILASDLSSVRITTVNGTDVFDAGSVSIIFEG